MIRDLSKITKEYDKNNLKLRIAIVRSNYHLDLTQSLEEGCKKYLIACGVKPDNIDTFEVPGSWEIPVAVKKAAETKKYDGLIALGIILKGDTYHFELIAECCARALMDIALKFNIPVAFEVLATYNLKQAAERSKGKYNKGIEAAKTVLETIKTLSRI